MNLYLSSLDYYDFEKPFEIVNFTKDQLMQREILIVDIIPYLQGQKYGHGDKEIRTLYLIPKFEKAGFKSFSKFPIFVYVLIPKIYDEKPKSLDDLVNIAWAAIYDSFKDAALHKLP